MHNVLITHTKCIFEEVKLCSILQIYYYDPYLRQNVSSFILKILF